MASPPLHGTPCLADRIILPTEDRITFCGAAFDIIHTPATPWTTSAPAPRTTSSIWGTP